MLIQKILKNTSYVLLAKLGNGVFVFVTALVAARALAVDDVGLYTFLLSLSALLVFVSTWGGNELLYRRGVSRPQSLGKMQYAASLVRLVFGAGLGALAVGAYGLWTLNGLHTAFLVLAFVAMMLDTQMVVYVVGARVRGNMALEAQVYMVRGAIKAGLVALVCWLSPGPGEVIGAILIANLWGWLLVRVRERGHYPPLTHAVGLGYLESFLRQSSPLFLMGVLSVVAAQVDVLLLGLLLDTKAVGLFAMPLQVFQTLLFVPMALNLVLQPLYVKIYQQSPSHWRRQVGRLAVGALVGALAAAGVLAATMPGIIPWVFGAAYASSSDIVLVLMLAFAVRLFFVTVVHTAYISANRVGIFNARLVVSLVVHVGVSVVLISMLGPVGAAWGILIGDAVSVFYGLYDFSMRR